jgi:hypothetical protein
LKVAVINCSHPYYNLGSQKLFNWLNEQGHDVTYHKGDPGLWALDAELVCLSVIFSWHAPIAKEIALRMKLTADVWCGGPGMFALANWWRKETGLVMTKGVDPRFESQPGKYLMTFASRGCPVNCSFCIVPKMEGLKQTLYWDFQPAPVLCDNNISALPFDFQRHIIKRYQETGITLRDANSGFEPHSFSEEMFQLWKPVIKGAWRFAYDHTNEGQEVYRMMTILKSVPASRKRVYCLVGNEPFEACLERGKKIIEWGGEPHCQFVLPLNWLGNDADLKPKYGWTIQQGRDFCRYFNRWLWRSVPLEDYKPRKHEVEPFKLTA